MLKFPPSSGSVWSVCHGQPKFLAGHQTSAEIGNSRQATDGDAIHYAASATLLAPLTALPSDLVGTETPDGVILTDAMCEKADIFVNEIRRHGFKNLHIEEKSNGYWGGIPDVWHYKNGVLNLWDLKTGYGLVECTDVQFICYIDDIIQDIKLSGELPGLVRITVVQPGPFHESGRIRTVEFNPQSYTKNISAIRNTRTVCESEDPQLTAGPHCKKCSRVYNCPASNRGSVDVMQFAMEYRLGELPTHELAQHYDMLKSGIKLLEARFDAVKERMLSDCTRGLDVGGYKTVRDYGVLKWNKSPREIVSLGKMMGVELQRPLNVVTPTQALGRNLDTSLVDAFASRGEGSLKLVKGTQNLGKEMFGEVK